MWVYIRAYISGVRHGSLLPDICNARSRNIRNIFSFFPFKLSNPFTKLSNFFGLLADYNIFFLDERK